MSQERLLIDVTEAETIIQGYRTGTTIVMETYRLNFKVLEYLVVAERSSK